MDLKMSGKVAIVTGGAKGIGRAIVETLLLEGVKVVIADLDPQRGEATTAELKAKYSDIAFVKTDTSKEKDVQNMVQFAVDTFGGLDYACNAAGYSIPNAKIEQAPIDDVIHMIMVDEIGVYSCCKYEIIEMLKRETPCAIVNISGNSGVVGSASGIAGYSMAKHGVCGLTKSVALEYAKSNIRVNVVCPGITETEAVASTRINFPDIYNRMLTSIPVGHTGKPEDIANVVAFLLSNISSYTSGACFLIDGAHTAQ